jgi:hypothetical protein
MSTQIIETLKEERSIFHSMSFQELKAECKRKNIEISKTDTKEILIKKLESYAAQTANNIGARTNVRVKMNKTKTCIVTKNDPEDIRDSALISITNVTGTYSHIVPFNEKTELPIPIIKKLQNTQVQKFKTVNKGILGNVDVPYSDNKYIVQILNK